MQIDYVVQYSRRKSLSIQVMENGKLLVKAPLGFNKTMIQSFLKEKETWIQNHITKQLEINKNAEKLGSFTKREIEEIKNKAKKIIPLRVEYYARLWGFTYNKVFIKLQKTRWGSCSTAKNLNFNCLLVLMPAAVLDSVVVHELCHLRHMNHSKSFYNEVYKIFPDYDKCDKWLKANGKIYLKRAEKL